MRGSRRSGKKSIVHMVSAWAEKNHIVLGQVKESKAEWTGLKTLIKIESERYIKGSGETEKETRLYISNLQADSELINVPIEELRTLCIRYLM
jgi:hypothetical protein